MTSDTRDPAARNSEPPIATPRAAILRAACSAGAGRFLTALLLAVLLPAAAALAQQTTSVVVPAGYEATDAPTLRWIAGAGPALRQQWLIDPTHLQPLMGLAIERLQFRRDASVDRTLLGGWMDVELRVSTSPASTAADARPSFDDNVGLDVALVCSGILAVPTSPAPGATPSWSPQDVIDIPFSTAFAYRGGVLCVDLHARPVAGQGAPSWPADAVADVVAGSVRYVGTSCQDPLWVSMPTGGHTQRVFANELVPGTTMTSFAFGKTDAVGFLAVGLDVLPQAVPLDAIGAVGCTLDVALLLYLPARVFDGPLDPIRPHWGGWATQDIHVPFSSALAGSCLAMQWVELSPTGLATTNAAVCDLASSVPTLGISLVEAHASGSGMPTTGKVGRFAVPVLRLIAR